MSRPFPVYNWESSSHGHSATSYYLTLFILRHLITEVLINVKIIVLFNVDLNTFRDVPRGSPVVSPVRRFTKLLQHPSLRSLFFFQKFRLTHHLFAVCIPTDCWVITRETIV